MNRKSWKAFRLIASVALLGAILACGGGDDDGEESTNEGTTAEGVAAAQPGAAPTALQIGGSPQALQVPIPPSFNLTVAAAAEYQLDANSQGAGDPELYLYQGENRIAWDDDGGEGNNARIIQFLAPATYSVRVVENQARSFTAQVSAQQLQPLSSTGALTLGAPSVVSFPEFRFPNRPRNNRDAARALTLNITAPGNYTCDAAADNNRDAKMALIQNGTMLAEDDDSGDGNNARISRQLQPGTYIVRVWDWLRRGDMRITVTCRAG